MDNVVDAFLEKDERVKVEERRAGMSGRFSTGILIVTPGRRTESFARGIIGIVVVAAKPMMWGVLLQASSTAPATKAGIIEGYDTKGNLRCSSSVWMLTQK